MPDTYNEVRSVYNRIKRLPQYKDADKDTVWEQAREIVHRNDIGIVSKFSNKEEQKLAKELVAKYLDDYTIETISEKNTLKEIIYLEVVQARLQYKLNEFHDTNKALPTTLIQTIHQNSDAIIRLKATLGLNKSSQKTEDTFDVLEHLKKRFRRYRDENQASRTLICPHCMKSVLLKIKTDIWEAQKHPFFKDRILYNKKVMDLYKQGTITRQDVADILECSADYANWVIDKIERPHPAEAPTEEVGDTSSPQDVEPGSTLATESLAENLEDANGQEKEEEKL
jgi:ribosomal protein L37AE/L43A